MTAIFLKIERKNAVIINVRRLFFMKKFLALTIAAVLVLLSVMPVFATDTAEKWTNTTLQQEVYEAYMQKKYDAYIEDISAIPDFSTPSFEQYCKWHPMYNMCFFEFIGTYSKITLASITENYTESYALSAHQKKYRVGKYMFEVDPFDSGFLYVYSKGGLYTLGEAYSDKIIDDAFLDALFDDAANRIGMKCSDGKAPQQTPIPNKTNDETNKIYAAYMAKRYKRYASEENDPKSFEEYCSFIDMDYFYEIKQLGECKNGALVWVISQGHILGIKEFFVGDFWLGLGCVYGGENEPGLVVYANGKMTYLPDAYEQGIITDSDMLKLCGGKHTIGDVKHAIRRIGDMNGDNLLDVSDIIALKERIMSMERYEHFDAIYSAQYSDFDRNGYLNVSDIIALKNHIMTVS